MERETLQLPSQRSTGEDSQWGGILPARTYWRESNPPLEVNKDSVHKLYNWSILNILKTDSVTKGPEQKAEMNPVQMERARATGHTPES